MKHLLYAILLVCALCVAANNARAQQTISSNDLNSLLEKAEKSADDYVESFKNLVAEESKTIEKFGKDGRVDDTRRVKSTLIVYQTQKENEVSEFRSVSEFNGKKVGRSDNDAIKFFENLTKSKSAEKELSQLQRESSRFDGSAIVWGVTLREGFILQKEVRPIFNFQIVGKERINSRDVVVVEYKQKEDSPFVVVNPRNEENENSVGRLEFNVALPGSLNQSNARLNGRFRLDAETGQIWKDEYQVSIQPPILNAPIVVSEAQFEYQSSKFNVLVPKKFVLTSYQVQNKNKEFRTLKFLETTLEYSAFSSVDSEVKDYQIKNK